LYPSLHYAGIDLKCRRGRAEGGVAVDHDPENKMKQFEWRLRPAGASTGPVLRVC
jgi:hypothetical protein